MKVLTLNLRHNNDHWELRKPLIIDLIQDLQPHIIGFQEVWMSFQQARQILEAVEGTPYELFVTPKQAHHGKEGVAIASRLPASEFESLDLPGRRTGRATGYDHSGWKTSLLCEYPFASST